MGFKKQKKVRNGKRISLCQEFVHNLHTPGTTAYVRLDFKGLQWVLQVMLPSACSFIVDVSLSYIWLSLFYTTCFGLHGHLQVCRVFLLSYSWRNLLRWLPFARFRISSTWRHGPSGTVVDAVWRLRTVPNCQARRRWDASVREHDWGRNPVHLVGAGASVAAVSARDAQLQETHLYVLRRCLHA
jgi:hypothetical protein